MSIKSPAVSVAAGRLALAAPTAPPASSCLALTAAPSPHGGTANSLQTLRPSSARRTDGKRGR